MWTFPVWNIYKLRLLWQLCLLYHDGYSPNRNKCLSFSFSSWKIKYAGVGGKISLENHLLTWLLLMKLIFNVFSNLRDCCLLQFNQISVIACQLCWFLEREKIFYWQYVDNYLLYNQINLQYHCSLSMLTFWGIHLEEKNIKGSFNKLKISVFSSSEIIKNLNYAAKIIFFNWVRYTMFNMSHIKVVWINATLFILQITLYFQIFGI